MFLPAYTPELNSIECLWSVIKKDFKRRLALVKFEKLDQTKFANMLQKSLDMITTEVQAKAASQNNREFLERIWNRELQALRDRGGEGAGQDDGAGAGSQEEIEVVQ